MNELVERYMKLQSEGRREEAVRFYFENLMDPVAKFARTCWKKDTKFREDFDLLVSLAGFSPQTTIIAARCLRPKELLVIRTADTKKKIDSIAKFVKNQEEDWSLPDSCFNFVECNPTDPLQIYSEIRKRVEQKVARSGEAQIAIDITGGKKVMSAIAGLIAWKLNTQICYIDSEYSQELRGPEPFSERILMLGNPLTIYKDDEIRMARRAFNQGRYSIARRDFGRLAASLPEPAYARLMERLSKLYESLCSFDLEGLGETIDDIENELRKPGSDLEKHLRTGESHSLEYQLTFLRKLIEGDRASRALAIFLIGSIARDQKNPHFTALLCYRAIESCLTYRLISEYGIGDTHDPDYTRLKEVTDSLESKYSNLMKSVLDPKDHTKTSRRNERRFELPPWLGFLNSAALLVACEDEMLVDSGFAGQKGLARLKSLSDTRNASILAHGYGKTGMQEAERLFDGAILMVEAFWKRYKSFYEKISFRTLKTRISPLHIEES